MNNLEIKRKIAHICVGIFIIITYSLNILKPKHLFFGIILFSILSLLSLKIRIPLISLLLDNFEREKDVKRFPFKGMIFFLIGSLLTVKLFTKDIALASITVLTLGDSTSYLFGYFLGKTKLSFNKLKNLEGILAGILLAFFGSLFFVNIFEAFFGSLIAMIIEGAGFRIGVNDIDDNFIVPLVAGTIIYLIRTEFHVFLF